MRAGDVSHLPFSAEVKEELAHVWPRTAQERMAELAGLVRACGTLELHGAGRVALRLASDYGSVARKALLLLKREGSVSTEVRVERRRRLRKNLRYTVRVPVQPGISALLYQAGVLDEEGRLQEDLPAWVPDRDSSARAFLRGFFLGAGSVSHPDRSQHLELVCPGPDLADALGQLLFSMGLPARLASRKDTLVLYLKGGPQISRFLALIGAHHHVLRYEDVRAYKEVRGQINRQVNAETANLDKTVDAAARQVRAIRGLQAAGRLDRLAAPLRELADLRVKYPEASLKELGELCNPPVGKSGVNHRMRLLIRLAADVHPPPAD